MMVESNGIHNNLLNVVSLRRAPRERRFEPCNIMCGSDRIDPFETNPE